MKIVHPNTSINGLPPENVFLAINSSGKTLGEGHIIITYKPMFIDDHPLFIYININSKNDVARNLIYGALMAYSYQFCKTQYPNLPASIYTQIAPDDGDSLEFYTNSGLQNKDIQKLIQIHCPAQNKQIPPGCEIRFTPIESQTDIFDLANRLNEYSLNPTLPQALLKCSESRNFVPLQIIIQGQGIVGECVFYSNKSEAMLVNMYVNMQYRKQGLGTLLLRQGIINLESVGIHKFYSMLDKRSMAQRKFATKCRSRDIRVIALYPNIKVEPMQYPSK